MDAKEGAELSRIAYLPQHERADAAGRLGYSIDSQDDDRVLFSKDGQGVLAFRGTDLKRPKNAWRDLLTDAAVLVGKAERTPRYLASEDAYTRAVQSKKYKSVKAVGHSLGGHQAIHIAKTFGAEAHAYNPAASIPDIARGIRDKIFGSPAKRATSYITSQDPISIGTIHWVNQDRVYTVYRPCNRFTGCTGPYKIHSSCKGLQGL